MPYKDNHESAERNAQRVRASRAALAERREKGTDQADRERDALQTLRASPEYKAWMDSWRTQEAQMNHSGFRGLDRSKGRRSGGV